MTLNFPGPAQLRIYYSVDADGLGPLQHVLQFNFISTITPLTPGTTFGNVDLIRVGEGESNMAGVTDEVVVVLKAILSLADATIDYAEIWQYEAGTFDAFYISSYTLGVAGTVDGDAVAASQIVYSFRSLEGGNMRVVVMESNQAPGASLSYAAMNADNQAFVDYIDHATMAPFVARDTSYPVAFTRMHPGQSESLFKRRYR